VFYAENGFTLIVGSILIGTRIILLLTNCSELDQFLIMELAVQ